MRIISTDDDAGAQTLGILAKQYWMLDVHNTELDIVAENEVEAVE